MTVKFENGKVGADEDIEALESAVGSVISADYKQFLRFNDGAEPELNIVAENRDVGVNRFIPVKQILEEAIKLAPLSEGCFPIAWAEGGNYILIDESQNGAIFFWDHESQEEPLKIALNFDSFLLQMKPFSIEVDRRRATRSWINPEFLRRQTSDKL